ncbi:hypothetical protein C3469_21810 [Mycobacterium kansasii]|nr:hypothetical protein C3469_21810 [Mycobacterium kansasii]POY31627.1 hypothetical protein C3478_15705 [Mycobacterium kansasii]
MFLDGHLDDQSLKTGAQAVATNFDPTLIATRAPRSRRSIYMSWVALGALALTCTESPWRAWPHTLDRDSNSWVGSVMCRLDLCPHRRVPVGNMRSESMAAALLSLPPEPWAPAVATVATRVTPHNAAGLARSASDAADEQRALAGGGVYGGLS